MSQSTKIYDAYRADVEKSNVQPEILRGNEVRDFIAANSLDWGASETNVTKFWSNNYRGALWQLSDGRVAEYNTDNSALMIPLLAVFPTRAAYDGYQKAMPRYFYMNH